MFKNDSPWPGQILVSLGNGASFFKEFCRSLGEEYDKSVLPTPSLNKVSPLKRILACRQAGFSLGK